jgi:pyrroline-5-carboxylate reductase
MHADLVFISVKPRMFDSVLSDLNGHGAVVHVVTPPTPSVLPG